MDPGRSGPTPWMVKVKPSAVLAPAVSWKVNCVVNLVTSTGLVEKRCRPGCCRRWSARAWCR